MSIAVDLLKSIQESAAGLTLNELQVRHPEVARRTAQRWISQLIQDGKITSAGKGRARRYFAVNAQTIASSADQDSFPAYIPLSADSRDILTYVDQPLEARKPVGYQCHFLDDYQSNQVSPRIPVSPAPQNGKNRSIRRTGRHLQPRDTESPTHTCPRPQAISKATPIRASIREN